MLSLVIFRVAQGVGAGGLVPISQTVVGDLYTPVERARIAGYLSSMWAIGSIIGPLLGAFLIAHTSWPWVFWINVPIAAAAALMLVLWLKEEVEHQARRIDYGGAVLLTTGSALLMFALVQSEHLGLPLCAAAVAVALVLLAWFFRLEQRLLDPMLPVALLRNRILASASLGCLFTGAILMGATAFVSLYVQGVMGRSALIAGLVLTTPSVTWVIGSATGGWIMLRSSYRATIVAGGLLLVAGGIIMVMLDPDVGPLVAGIGVGLVGIGMGLTTNHLYGGDARKRRLGAARRRHLHHLLHAAGGSGPWRRDIRRHHQRRAREARRRRRHCRPNYEPGAPPRDPERYDRHAGWRDRDRHQPRLLDHARAGGRSNCNSAAATGALEPAARRAAALTGNNGAVTCFAWRPYARFDCKNFLARRARRDPMFDRRRVPNSRKLVLSTRRRRTRARLSSAKVFLMLRDVTPGYFGKGGNISVTGRGSREKRVCRGCRRVSTHAQEGGPAK
jgi:MFS family permease